MDQLRATFIGGRPNAPTAQETFTNRVGELDAFKVAVRQLLHQAERVKVEDYDLIAPRRNVLVYYGIGGVGKTALSKRLQRYLDDEGVGLSTQARALTIRMDFGEAGEFSVEAMLLRMRAALSGISKRWPAFDLAFTLAWEKLHPGETLPAFIRQNSALRYYADKTDLAEQMQSSLVEVLSELGLAWSPTRIAVRMAALTHERLNRSRTYATLMRECPYFAPIATASDPLEGLGYMASLLGWQLHKEVQNQPVLMTVFLDTFEAISDRQSRELERHVQRLVFFLPDALFVVTSRNRIDWAEIPTSGELDYVGESRWPYLHVQNTAGEPRQHLVGNLSDADCEIYLCTVLTEADGAPALSRGIRARIISGSSGLPLYLDLSVTQYLEMSAARQPIRAEDFGGPLSSLVIRIMRNLDKEQRSLVRGVSLLDTFDAELASVASQAADATAARFLQGSLVVTTTGLGWPYALHAQLRRTIRESDHELRDAWSRREWHGAAERVLALLGHKSREGRDARNRSLVARCFSQAARLALDFQHVPDWLIDTAQYLSDVGSWESLDVRQAGSMDRSSTAAGLIHGLRGIALRRSGSLEESIRCFDVALSTPHLDPNTSDLLALHRTHSLRNAGKYEKAQRSYEELTTRPGFVSERARLQLADISLLKGRFIQALVELGDMPDEDSIVGEVMRLRGHTYRFNGRLEEAELHYRQALEHGRELGSSALEGKALTNLAETSCWRSPDDGERLANEAIAFNSAVGNQLEVLKAHVARALSTTGPVSARSVDEALSIARVSQYRAGRIFALTASLFTSLVSAGSPAESERVAWSIRRLSQELRVYRYLANVAEWWWAASHGSTLRLSERQYADWLGDEVGAEQRWTAVLAARRENHE